MDLSGLKWPIIIVVIVGVGFLATSPGINYMVKNFTTAVPGQDAARDKTDEAGLTRVGGYLMYLFQYQKAMDVMNIAIERYGTTGANYWYNKYRMVRCLEKQKNFKGAHDLLQDLITNDAKQYDSRVPNIDNLRLRAAKIKEVNGL